MGSLFFITSICSESNQILSHKMTVGCGNIFFCFVFFQDTSFFQGSFFFILYRSMNLNWNSAPLVIRVRFSCRSSQRRSNKRTQFRSSAANSRIINKSLFPSASYAATRVTSLFAIDSLGMIATEKRSLPSILFLVFYQDHVS